MSCDKKLKLRNQVLLQYYHEHIISLENRARKLSDVELTIKLLASSVEECFFKDLWSEIYVPFEKKKNPL